MLDLGLEHLGVEVPNKKVQALALEVVRTCGTSQYSYILRGRKLTRHFFFSVLQKLEDVEYRSPAKKASLFVEAHKSIVGGLIYSSMLPEYHNYVA